jgi:hypothetical protein
MVMARIHARRTVGHAADDRRPSSQRLSKRPPEITAKRRVTAVLIELGGCPLRGSLERERRAMRVLMRPLAAVFSIEGLRRRRPVRR